MRVSSPLFPPQTIGAFLVNWPVRLSALASTPAPSEKSHGHGIMRPKKRNKIKEILNETQKGSLEKRHKQLFFGMATVP